MATKVKSAGTAPGQTAAATPLKRIRKLFGNIHEAVEMPNLIEVQRDSYEQFLRSDPSIGYVSGLEKRCAAFSRSAILPAPPNLILFIMNSSRRNMTSMSAVSAGSLMPRR